jgi:hypothetical protein
MNKSFAQAPKPPQLSAEVISAFERSGAGQDTRGHIPSIVETRAPTNVGSMPPTNGGTGRTTNTGLGVTTKPGKTEPTRRLSIDLPESWHRRFKIACTRADKKMIDEVTEFIKQRTLELENE